MVMTCYNKVEYIGEMLDSVIEQEWDNIELILVNDGSTDGTREVISEYEPILTKRGFEVVIVDQENSGVCAAAKAGFERITGDYMCSIDCDDELDPKYVSTLAGWLAEHEDYDIAACEGISYTIYGKIKQFNSFTPIEILDGDPFIVERWLLKDFMAAPWIYMVRVEYFRKCRIVETYCTQTKGSHEPSLVIPLLTYRGKLKYFPAPLYRFNVTGVSHSRHKYAYKIKEHNSEYARLCTIAINALPDEVADAGKKRNFINATVIGSAYRAYHEIVALVSCSVYPSSFSGILAAHAYQSASLQYDEFMDVVNTSLSISPAIGRDRTMGIEGVFIEMVRNCLASPKYRIVGCGVSGKIASRFLPIFEGTPLEPTELWDETGNGNSIKKPDYSSLTSSDIAIVFPSSKGDIASNIIGKLAGSGCAIITSSDLYLYESHYLAFPELKKIGRPAR